MNNPLVACLKSPLFTAPWIEIQKEQIPLPAKSREPFRFWAADGKPTQPDPESWLKYNPPELWISVLRTEKFIRADSKGLHQERLVREQDFIKWPYILNYCIVNIGYIAGCGKWDDVKHIDGNHNRVYSKQKPPSFDQLNTINNIYFTHFKRNYPSGGIPKELCYDI